MINSEEGAHRRSRMNFVHIGTVPTNHILKLGKMLPKTHVSLLLLPGDQIEGDYKWMMSGKLDAVPKDDATFRLVERTHYHT